MLILFSHLGEHLLQCFEIYFLGWSPMKAGGLLGLLYPQLIHNETLHFSFALFHLIGLFWFAKLIKTEKSKWWWQLAIYIQLFHFTEHVQLLLQHLHNLNYGGGKMPATIIQVYTGIPRPLLHLLYNLVAMMPIIKSLNTQRNQLKSDYFKLVK